MTKVYISRRNIWRLQLTCEHITGYRSVLELVLRFCCLFLKLLTVSEICWLPVSLTSSGRVQPMVLKSGLNAHFDLKWCFFFSVFIFEQRKTFMTRLIVTAVVGLLSSDPTSCGIQNEATVRRLNLDSSDPHNCTCRLNNKTARLKICKSHVALNSRQSLRTEEQRCWSSSVRNGW